MANHDKEDKETIKELKQKQTKLNTDNDNLKVQLEIKSKATTDAKAEKNCLADELQQLRD